MFGFPDSGFTKLHRRTMQKLSKQTAGWARQNRKKNGLACTSQEKRFSSEFSNGCVMP
jgi:hypothetical protein